MTWSLPIWQGGRSSEYVRTQYSTLYSVTERVYPRLQQAYSLRKRMYSKCRYGDKLVGKGANGSLDLSYQRTRTGPGQTDRQTDRQDQTRPNQDQDQDQSRAKQDRQKTKCQYQDLGIF